MSDSINIIKGLPVIPKVKETFKYGTPQTVSFDGKESTNIEADRGRLRVFKRRRYSIVKF